MLPKKGKGKARASERTERDTLLPSSSASPSNTDVPRRSQRTRPILLTAAFILLSVLFAAALFLILLAYSFKPSESELDALPRTAFKYSSPENVQVLNITDDGILVNVALRCGIDADKALGLEIIGDHDGASECSGGMRGGGAAWWEAVRRWTARKAVDQLPGQGVQVTVPSSIHISSNQLASLPLLSLHLLDDLFVPLIQEVGDRPPSDWLEPLTFTALAKPIASTGQLFEFLQRAWVEGELRVVIGVEKVEVKLPEGAWWTRYGRGEKEDLVLKVEMPVPPLRGLPTPGHHLNLSQMVHLDSYSFYNDESTLHISAQATLPNPLPDDFDTTIPFGVPFAISLGDGLKMAEVITEPIHLASSETITLRMSGHITANLSEEAGLRRDSALSTFLQNFLHGIDNPIVVNGLSRLPSFASEPDHPPPPWLLSSLPSLSLPLSFPGPRPPPKIIQSVTIERMRISESGGKMRASGTVVAEIELPQGMQNVDFFAKEVLPDLLVYDGPASSEEPDPQDPPPRAFGHIQPDDFLPAITYPSTDPFHPHRFVVRAPIVNVPLEVLKGRDSVLSDFVGRVVFKGGAQAGVKGTASVRVELDGVNGKVRLDDLPVQGEFWVGKQRSLPWH